MCSWAMASELAECVTPRVAAQRCCWALPVPRRERCPLTMLLCRSSNAAFSRSQHWNTQSLPGPGEWMVIATAMLAAATMILLEFGKTSRVPRAMESCHRDGTVCGQHPHVNKPAILLSESRWSSPLVAACVWEAVHSPGRRSRVYNTADLSFSNDLLLPNRTTKPKGPCSEEARRGQKGPLIELWKVPESNSRLR